MAPHCYLGHEASRWRKTSQFLTPIPSLTQTRQTEKHARLAAANKIVKYGVLSAPHIFFPITVETAGTCNQSAIELVQEIGGRYNIISVKKITCVLRTIGSHRRHKRDGVPVPATVHYSPKGECGRFPCYI